MQERNPSHSILLRKNDRLPAISDAEWNRELEKMFEDQPLKPFLMKNRDGSESPAKERKDRFYYDRFTKTV